jgi:hypothetical protein
MTRKIVQISTLIHVNNVFVYALCDDGTLWCSIKGIVGDFYQPINPVIDDDWGLVANVPQLKRFDGDQDDPIIGDKFFKKFNY